METAIEVKGLCKQYPGFALEDVSFSLPCGAIMGFIGANGAGKTTTIKSMLGLIRMGGGEIRLLGGSPGEHDVRAKLGVVMDENTAYDTLTLKQAAKVERTLRTDWDEELWQSYVQSFELPDKKQIKEYSRGMKVKLYIALALAHRPQLLILDEPTSGLDPIMREQVLDIFLDFIQDEQHAILLSSHITGDLDKIADYITFIHQGRIIFSRDKLSLQDDWAVVRCGEAEFAAIPAEHMVRWRKNSYGCEALVHNRKRLAAAMPQLTLERVTTEEIMLFYVQGQGRDK